MEETDIPSSVSGKNARLRFFGVFPMPLDATDARALLFRSSPKPGPFPWHRAFPHFAGCTIPCASHRQLKKQWQKGLHIPFLPDDVRVDRFNLAAQRNESDDDSRNVRGRFRDEENSHARCGQSSSRVRPPTSYTTFGGNPASRQRRRTTSCKPVRM